MDNGDSAKVTVEQSSSKLEEHNQFLDLFTRFHCIQRKQYQGKGRDNRNHSKNRVSEPKLGRDKAVTLVNPNRSVRSILKEKEMKEKIRRQKVQTLEKTIQEQIVKQKRLRQYIVAQKKLKNRLAIEQKRLERQKQSQSLKPSSQKAILLPSLSDLHNKAEDSKQKTQKREKIFSNSVYNDQKIFKVSSSEVLNPLKQGRSLPPKKALKTSILQQCIKKDQSQFSTKVNRRKAKTKQLFSEPNPQNCPFHGNKSIKSLAKSQEKTMQKQLQSLYAEESRQSLGKAVELVQKIENKYRLRLKNINDKDYRQARNKLKLLSFFYSHDV